MTDQNILPAAIDRLTALLHARIPPHLEAEVYATPEERQLADLLNRLIDYFAEIRDFILPLAHGELRLTPPQTKNFLASPFKELHSQLRHLTWQAQQVAKGDYSQRVAFMGDFAAAFNAMVESLAAKEAALLAQARTDALTGLPNRLKLNEVLASELARYQRYKTPFSLALFDIDHFKQINDTYGHQQGDQVLQQVARVVRQLIRAVDTVGRWGGEEFLLVLPETPLAGAVTTVERLRQAVAAADYGPVGRVTASFGVAEVRAGDDADKLLRRADTALYRAKNRGRNRVEVEEA